MHQDFIIIYGVQGGSKKRKVTTYDCPNIFQYSNLTISGWEQDRRLSRMRKRRHPEMRNANCIATRTNNNDDAQELGHVELVEGEGVPAVTAQAFHARVQKHGDPKARGGGSGIGRMYHMYVLNIIPPYGYMFIGRLPSTLAPQDIPFHTSTKILCSIPSIHSIQTCISALS